MKPGQLELKAPMTLEIVIADSGEVLQEDQSVKNLDLD